MVVGVESVEVDFESAVQFFDELYLLEVFCRSTDGLKVSALIALVTYSLASSTALTARVAKQSTL